MNSAIKSSIKWNKAGIVELDPGINKVLKWSLGEPGYFHSPGVRRMVTIQDTGEYRGGGNQRSLGQISVFARLF